MRDVFPVKFYSDEGFVEYKVEITDDDLEEIIGDYLTRNAKFDFDEIEVVNNRPVNVWLYSKCRKYVDPDATEAEQGAEAAKLGAEVNVTGEYDGNPTGGGSLMCGRFTLKTSRAKIAELIGLHKSLPLFEPRYNIAPLQPVLAVRIEPERGEREGTFFKWGLIPSWA